MGSKQPAARRAAAMNATSEAMVRVGMGSKRAPRRRPVRTRPPVTAEERHRMIAECAYHRAQRRGFAAGAEVQDWLEAEAEVDSRLREG
mgnify:CR=1 FL=1